ncbi:hypothetical protein ACVMII_009899 [Bradyrhizobium diazoefficiens]
MGKAIAYLLNHWDGLTLFLDDGCVEMDTNPVEKSWPRLFGQRPAGFKWIPAGLC